MWYNLIPIQVALHYEPMSKCRLRDKQISASEDGTKLNRPHSAHLHSIYLGYVELHYTDSIRNI